MVLVLYWASWTPNDDNITLVQMFRLANQLYSQPTSPLQRVVLKLECSGYYWYIIFRFDGVGGWSSKGCSVDSVNATHVNCSCNHLTNFAVIVDNSYTMVT